MEWISIIIGVAGFLFGIYAYLKNRSVKALTVIYSNTLIEANSPAGVELVFLETPVSHFIRYQITLFNHGNKTLYPQDFREPFKLGFENMELVSHTEQFASEDVNPVFVEKAHDLVVNFDHIAPNQHITFEVLAGTHSAKLLPPVCKAEILEGQPIAFHQQVFFEEDNRHYQALSSHLGMVLGSGLIGLVLLIIAGFSKYESLAAVQSAAIITKLELLCRVESVPMFMVFMVSLVLLFYAYEAAKVLKPKLRRYKFEQFIQHES
ncbi:hypothetical protein [Leucothrix mucor]|uniref:hypothetical protein n=1 Tax=Leucothrix mucor TaxID=45248 RepID=UPI0003B68E06|nr:hypothetical protein [Leucothrix mucor]